MILNYRVLTNKLTANIPNEIINEALSLGIPPTALAQIVPAVAGANATAVATALVTLGINPSNIPGDIGALFGALSQAYAESFRYVWIIDTVFCVLALVSIAVSLLLCTGIDEKF